MVVKEGQSLNLYADLQDVMFRPNTRAGVNDANRPQYCISSHERGYGFPRILLLGSPVNRGNGSLLNAYTGLLQLARRGPRLLIGGEARIGRRGLFFCTGLSGRGPYSLRMGSGLRK